MLMMVMMKKACGVREESEAVELFVDGRWVYMDLCTTMRRGEETVLHRDLHVSLQPSDGDCIVCIAQIPGPDFRVLLLDRWFVGTACCRRKRIHRCIMRGSAVIKRR
jgi:hypothetical protein